MKKGISLKSAQKDPSKQWLLDFIDQVKRGEISPTTIINGADLTPLFLSASREYTDSTEELEYFLQDLDLLFYRDNSLGRTIIHYVIMNGSVKHLKCIIRIASENKILQKVIGITDNYGSTALHYAVNVIPFHPMGLVETLLLNGSDPNALSTFGESPLFVACIRNRSRGKKPFPIVRMLLEYGASLEKSHRDGGDRLLAEIDKMDEHRKRKLLRIFDMYNML